MEAPPVVGSDDTSQDQGMTTDVGYAFMELLVVSPTPPFRMDRWTCIRGRVPGTSDFGTQWECGQFSPGLAALPRQPRYRL